jgi:hypothetical protein
MPAIDIHRLINATAATALIALTSCGDATDEEQEETLYEYGCRVSKECIPEEFDNDFDSLDECEDHYEEYSQFLEETSDSDCVSADKALSDCFYKALESNCSAEDTLNSARDACRVEIDEFFDTCE